jgi:hypothetical protein
MTAFGLMKARLIHRELEFKQKNARPSAAGASTEHAAPGQVIFCMSSRGPSTDRLLRFASHLDFDGRLRPGQ